jgi:hypothetical protein
VTTNGRASDCVATGAFYRDDDFNDPESNYLMPETWAKTRSGQAMHSGAGGQVAAKA